MGTTYNCKQRVLAERSQIAQFFQWLPRSRQTREGKVRVAGLVLGPGLRLEAVMRRMLIVTAAGAAMLPRAKPTRAPGARGHRRRGHARELQRANLRDVRAGGDCGQPRSSAIRTRAGRGPAGGPGDRAPAKARRLLTDAVAPP